VGLIRLFNCISKNISDIQYLLYVLIFTQYYNILYEIIIFVLCCYTNRKLFISISQTRNIALQESTWYVFHSLQCQFALFIVIKCFVNRLTPEYTRLKTTAYLSATTTKRRKWTILRTFQKWKSNTQHSSRIHLLTERWK
jgi:hypothetical protein